MLDPLAFSSIAEQYFGRKGSGFVNPTRRWEFPWVVEQLRPGVPDAEICFGPVGEGWKIMDAGAGKTPLPIYLAIRAASVVTVDRGNDQNEWGFFDYNPSMCLITSWNRDFSDLSIAGSETFDAVVSVSTLEHTPADTRRKAMAEFYRILKFGSRLVITLDTEGPQRSALFNLEIGEGLVDPEGTHGTVASVIQEALNVGFRFDKYEVCPLAPHMAREVVVHVVGMVFSKG